MHNMIYERSEPLYDINNRWTGGYALHETDKRISEGSSRRLVVYARQRLADAGHVIPDDWAIEVEAFGDRGDIPTQREYCVRFINAKKGAVGVHGIWLTSQGHPHVDHGLFIE